MTTRDAVIVIVGLLFVVQSILFAESVATPLEADRPPPFQTELPINFVTDAPPLYTLAPIPGDIK